MEREFPGENESVNHIERAVIVKDSYQEGSVSASWSFEDTDVIDLHGKVTAEELPPEGVPLKARVTLVCGESERTEEFYFRISRRADRGGRTALADWQGIKTAGSVCR